MMRFLKVITLVLILSIGVSHAAIKDPTMPPEFSPQFSYQSGDISRFQLMSIIHGKFRRYAIINQEMVSEGALIEGAKVLSINRQSVILKQGEKTWHVKFDEPTVRKSIQ